MNTEEKINKIFEGYIRKKGVKKEITGLIEYLTLSDVDILLDKIEVIGDVDDYANDFETSIPVERFFAFVDLISALIIFLGSDAVKKASERNTSKSRYMPWVIKFIQDERFYKQIKEQLPSKYR